jgi:lipoprotein-anchoring transpeptidase ErfK/SrfK
MATDYYSILSRAISGLKPNTGQSRRAVYDRARRAISDFAASSKLSGSDLTAQASALEAAIDRLEASFARPAASPRPHSTHGDAGKGIAKIVPRLQRVFPAPHPTVLGGLAVLTLLVVGGFLYAFLKSSPEGGASVGSLTPRSAPTLAAPKEIKFVADTSDVEPGIDGGSSESGIPYVYRRQPVFFRTSYAVGTIIVDRPQRFLYLVQPNNVALRYGIGVGADCAETTGLRHISRKVEWPEWQASDETIKRFPRLIHSVPGGPGNPFGARALFLDDSVQVIHGTNSPKTIGSTGALGCFRLVNDGVIDLYDRTAIEAKVVTRN